MTKIFIDGREGTTGLRIYDRLASREDIELIILKEEDRKNPEKRKEAINSSDISFLCLPDAAAMWCVGPASLQRLQNSLAPQVKRVLIFVSPNVKIGPSSFTPSATTNLKLPFLSCVIPRYVTGPK